MEKGTPSGTNNGACVRAGNMSMGRKWDSEIVDVLLEELKEEVDVAATAEKGQEQCEGGVGPVADVALDGDVETLGSRRES